MPRISKIPPDQADPQAREAFDAFIKERGKVPNMTRTVAHRQEIMVTMTDHFRAVMTTGNVERKLKELVAVRVSHLNKCEY
jgi:alkylhydroperoxidase family enzyme